jgi:predicted AAA+ superfamily ATPase
MISRPFWLNRIENTWREAPICLLAGVRHAGKTTLAKSLSKERMVYVNCDLPVTRDRIADALKIFRGFYGRGVNYLVCPVPAPGYQKRISGMEIRVCNPDGLLG